ncbi:MAG: threonine synthase [Chloroflexi bacterium]|nr:threonine synthase [Chloroflexota bacterium]
MKQNYIGYVCSICGTEYGPQEVEYVCPKDGGNLSVVLDYASIQRSVRISDITGSADYSMWRYLPLLPVGDPQGTGTPLRSVGWTPVYHSPQLTRQLETPNLWVKDESSNPSASFKDRASALVVVRSREIEAEVIVTASTGNAGAALAGMAAAVGQKAVIFAPKSAPPAKIAQLLVFGAQVILVDGNYDQAFDLSLQASQSFGWYCRNTGYNPFTAEGKKTAAFEIWEQVILPSQSPSGPLNIFVSVGDGNIISGIHKGFQDLQKLGWLDEMPRLFAVQAEGSSAVANAILNGTEEIIPVKANTLADSICVDLPRDGLRAVRAVKQTGGDCIVVSDGEILKAISQLGRSGIFAEPAGAAAFAGLSKALDQGKITPEDCVLVLNTGSGIKDTRAAMMAVPEAPIIEPSLADLRRYLGTLSG